MTRVLLVDDERDLIWAVQHSLSDEGYEVLTAYDGTEALTVARRHRPDLIILDIVMPRLDGLQVCHRLRRDPKLATVPILFLTVRSAIEDRIKGLDRGGDDYLVKPFDMGELRARIRALLRRRRPALNGASQSENRNSLLVVGPLTLDLHTCQVNVNGQTVQLTPTEFDLLRYLMVHPGEIFSSQRLLQQVWGYCPETADPSLVRWHIKNLREKIEPDPAQPVYIRTVPRHGYMLERRGSFLL
ncbi:MAG: response regulator transcription factor [Anaerolineae bacterium]